MQLTQLSNFLISPLGFGLIGLALAWLLSFARCHRLARASIAVVVIVLWVFSTPAIVEYLVSIREKAFPPQVLPGLAHSDVAIVLGGGMDGPVPPRLFPDLAEAADRVWHGARLYHLGKVDYVLVAGGLNSASGRYETDEMALFLHDLGVPDEKILRESKSLNTYGNAVLTAKIWRERNFTSGYLVTSAVHMARSLRVFRGQGLPVVPVAIDHQGLSPQQRSLKDWLPSTRALHLSQRLFHEIIGSFVYRWRGWG